MPCKLVDEGQHARRLEGRLQAARQRAFVGRKEELAAFEEALCTGGRVLFIHGPGGVGKSALLRRFAQRAAAADRTVLMLDGRSLEESPAAFVAEARAVQRLRAGHRTQRHRPRTHDARDGTPPRRSPRTPQATEARARGGSSDPGNAQLPRSRPPLRGRCRCAAAGSAVRAAGNCLRPALDAGRVIARPAHESSFVSLARAGAIRLAHASGYEPALGKAARVRGATSRRCCPDTGPWAPGPCPCRRRSAAPDILPGASQPVGLRTARRTRAGHLPLPRPRARHHRGRPTRARVRSIHTKAP
ncbi:ATP-binding protein [Streptomyces sp. NBC_00046]|uniref:ATP-binding protein n=1 Tax=Streptomyces sp. NBC_00046 TaxID=2975626 RepID=UPI003870C3B2